MPLGSQVPPLISWHECFQKWSPHVIRHVWSRMKQSYYPNAMFCIIRHIGLKCRNVEGFQENNLFQWELSVCIHNEDM